MAYISRNLVILTCWLFMAHVPAGAEPADAGVFLDTDTGIRIELVGVAAVGDQRLAVFQLEMDGKTGKRTVYKEGQKVSGTGFLVSEIQVAKRTVKLAKENRTVVLRLSGRMVPSDDYLSTSATTRT